MKNKIQLLTIAFIVVALHASAQVTGTFTDSRDGKLYKTVKIGTQTWMAENLAFKSDNGCYAYENNDNNVKTCGYLYTWKTATKVCPSGWHLPSQNEWETLFTYLGDDTTTVGKIIETGNDHWKNPVAHATNESGFTAIPNGFRNKEGEFYGFRDVLDWADWWSSTEDKDNSDQEAYNVQFYNISKDVTRGPTDKKMGFSVRCIKE